MTDREVWIQAFCAALGVAVVIGPGNIAVHGEQGDTGLLCCAIADMAVGHCPKEDK